LKIDLQNTFQNYFENRKNSIFYFKIENYFQENYFAHHWYAWTYLCMRVCFR